jgi:3',5'-nucleoside bisphosphate phosphatase
MRTWKADMHIHSVLSPCGSLDSSPKRIIEEAVIKGLGIIAITDHNSTLHCELSMQLGKSKNIKVFAGAEVTTKEEIHCLCLFETLEQAEEFQLFINEHLPHHKNDPDLFGDQVIVDADDMIIEEYPFLLVNALEADIQEVEQKVHLLNGLFIPAHIDKAVNSLYSQMGIYPSNLEADALEISRFSDENSIREKMAFIPEGISFIRNSDSHYIGDIGSSQTIFEMEEPSFVEIRKAFKNHDNRKVIIQ